MRNVARRFLRAEGGGAYDVLTPTRALDRLRHEELLVGGVTLLGASEANWFARQALLGVRFLGAYPTEKPCWRIKSYRLKWLI